MEASYTHYYIIGDGAEGERGYEGWIRADTSLNFIGNRIILNTLAF